MLAVVFGSGSIVPGPARRTPSKLVLKLMLRAKTGATGCWALPGFELRSAEVKRISGAVRVRIIGSATSVPLVSEFRLYLLVIGVKNRPNNESKSRRTRRTTSMPWKIATLLATQLTGKVR